MHSDGIAYSFELDNCDGTTEAVRDATQCVIEVSTLRNAPYSLSWGSSVTCKLIAYNVYGDSLESEPGNGGVIITYPDAPVNLHEVIAQRTPASITISWSEGQNNGGSEVYQY